MVTRDKFVRMGLVLGILLWGAQGSTAGQTVNVRSLLKEMADFENLAQRPQPFFKEAMASSYSRESHKGGEAWFHNNDAGQYIRKETNSGRTEYVVGDLTGPGTITRFWSANPRMRNIARFYFDGETEPRLAVPLAGLFTGNTAPFASDFSYISATGGNLYYPIPYQTSLKITVEENANANEPVKPGERPKTLRLYYEIGYRTYPAGTQVETFDAQKAGTWRDVQDAVGRALYHPAPALALPASEWIKRRVTILPGETFRLPAVLGEKAVYTWSARVSGTKLSRSWDDPLDPLGTKEGRNRDELKWAANAYRFLLLEISFDGEKSIATPLGDFFGSGPGVNPYANLYFTVDETGRMVSRLLMPFRKSMNLSLTNAGQVPYTVELDLHVGPHVFTARSYHLRAQWGALTRDSWPPFDINFLDTSGEGKVIGTVYQIANPVLIWWGEGDQKVFVDGEAFPSTFGTGTEDDYGYAYGNNEKFTRPYHAQTRVDGPWSGGQVSLNRWYVLDALPYRKGIRFDDEVWHWIPCRPTWNHVIYWYAKPGAPGPREIDRAALEPVDLGIRDQMLEPMEGEALGFEATGGKAVVEQLANCAGAEHLVWQDAKPGGRLKVQFTVPATGRYSIELNLCMSPSYGRQRLYVNGVPVEQTLDEYSPKLYFLRPQLGVFDLKQGANVLEVEALDPNQAAQPGNRFGLDYVFLVRQ